MEFSVYQAILPDISKLNFSELISGLNNLDPKNKLKMKNRYWILKLKLDGISTNLKFRYFPNSHVLKLYIFPKFNGSNLYREYYKLASPTHFCCNGYSQNYLLPSEILSAGYSPYHFTINVLPEFLITKLAIVQRLVKKYLQTVLSPLLTSSDLLAGFLPPHQVSLQYIEIANQWHVIKTLDPVINPFVLEALQSKSSSLTKRKFVKRPDGHNKRQHRSSLVVAGGDWVTEKGQQQLVVKFLDQGVKGSAYVNYTADPEYDAFKFETKFSGPNGGTPDTLYKVAGHKQLAGGAATLKTIFNRLCRATHDLTVDLFAVPYPAITQSAKRELIFDRLLGAQFDHGGGACFNLNKPGVVVAINSLARELIRSNLTVHVSQVPRMLQRAVRNMAKHGVLFSSSYSKSGFYTFDRALLGGSN
jgi:hypothetical protein